jgi:AraC-like DNA-binding protein
LKHCLLPPLFQAKALKPLLNSGDFDQWQSVVGRSLGAHHSTLRSPAKRFLARMAFGQAGALQLLHLEGQGQIELKRMQGSQHAVLWLPLQGWCQERINGTRHIAEPGEALLLRPGDELEGTTSTRLEGVSILLPGGAVRPGLPSHIGSGRHNRALVDAALCFAGAVATGQLGSEHAASTLLDTLLEWERLSGDGLGNKQERITAVRRRTYVGEARAWMRLHLGEPIGIQQAAAAVAVSPRTLQYAFLTELGRTPMAELKRLRLRALRQLLQGPGQRHTSIADLMVRSGLLACGSTAAEYRRYCGESPHETREQMRNSI